jgi:iron complex transport system ATP-binding protein
MIKINNLSYIIKKNKILKNINLEISSNSITTIIGPNGSGKTSFLKCIASLVDTCTGCVYYDGVKAKDIPQGSFAKLLGWLDQSAAVGFDFRVIDIVLMGRYPWHQGYPLRDDYKKALQVLSIFAMDGMSQRLFYSLSGGQKQVVMIARLLVGEQKYLLLDEPTVHLDSKNTLRFYEYLQVIKKDKTIVLVTHDYLLLKCFPSALLPLFEGEIRSVYKNSSNRDDLCRALEDIDLPKLYINQLV